VFLSFVKGKIIFGGVISQLLHLEGERKGYGTTIWHVEREFWTTIYLEG
jgi:hypothetical protein